MVTRYAIYARVSTELDSQKDSIDHQVSFFNRYVEEKCGSIYDIYKDEGVSGTSLKGRSEIKRLLNDAQSKRFDCVLFKSISRFARDLQDGINMKRELDDLGVGLIFVEQNIDTRTSEGELFFSIHLSIAQQESEQISKRVKFGRREKAIKGKFNGSLPPFGYKREGNNLVVDEHYAPVVKEIFRLYLYENLGLYRISKLLFNKGVPTPRSVSNAKNAGEFWQQNTLKLILTNSHYMGHMNQHRSEVKSVRTKKRLLVDVTDRIIVKDTHTALVSEEDFHQVQSKLSIKGKLRSNGQENLLAHIAVCGDCGAGMHFKKDRDGYQCGKYGKFGKAHCSSHLIKNEHLIKQVKKSLAQLNISGRIQTKRLIEIAKKESGTTLISSDKELKQVEKRINQLIQKQSRLLDQHYEGDLTKEEWKQQHELIRNELTEIQIRKLELLKVVNQNKDMEGQFHAFEKQVIKLLSLDIDDMKILKQVIEKLIHKIEVFDDKSIKIHFNFRNPNAREGA